MKKNTDWIKINDHKKIAIKADGTKIPVVDSKLHTVLQPNEDDIKSGVPGDPTRCMYAQACKRMFGSDLVWVGRSVAYVELLINGKPQLHRFILKDPAKVKAQGFDLQEEVSREAVVFEAPKGTERLKAMRTAYQQRTERQKTGDKSDKSTVQRSEKSKVKPRRATKSEGLTSINLALRRKGTGLFRFKTA